MAQKTKTFADIKGKKKARRESVRIAFDSEVLEEHAAAKKALDLAERKHVVRKDDPVAEKAYQEALRAFEEADKKLKENSVVFVFRAMGRKMYERLINDHPPTKEQVEEFDKQVASMKERGETGSTGELPWNIDTFIPALLAASSEDPKLTEEEAREMWDSPEWNESDIYALFNAAVMANTAPSLVHLGKD